MPSVHEGYLCYGAYENIYKRLKNVRIVMEGLQLGQRLQFLNKELSQ